VSLLIHSFIHSLFGHICRLQENTPASQALQLSIEAHTGTPPAADWKRPPGRPRRNWLQQVEEDIGLSVGAAWIAGQDRSMWRTLRPSAGQAQQWVSESLLIIGHVVVNHYLRRTTTSYYLFKYRLLKPVSTMFFHVITGLFSSLHFIITHIFGDISDLLLKSPSKMFTVSQKIRCCCSCCCK